MRYLYAHLPERFWVRRRRSPTNSLTLRQGRAGQWQGPRVEELTRKAGTIASRPARSLRERSGAQEITPRNTLRQRSELSALPFGSRSLRLPSYKSDLGVEVAFTDIGAGHSRDQARRAVILRRLQDFSQGIAALYKDRGNRMRNVVILTMTEFGRTIRQNGSGGTDHGHASVVFALGGPVKGGKVYGKWPGLATEQLYEGRDLALTTDFRDVFSEIAARHLGTTSLGAIFPGFNPKPANFPGLIRG